MLIYINNISLYLYIINKIFCPKKIYNNNYYYLYLYIYMSYSVIAPFATPISVVGNSFPEAVKNFVKLQHDISLNQFIITDQVNNMHAYVEYINKQKGNGRSHKNARIRMKPTFDRVLPGYPSYPGNPGYPGYPGYPGIMAVPSSGPMGMVTGFPINGPAAGMPPGFLFVPPDSSKTSVDPLTTEGLNAMSEENIKRAVMATSPSIKQTIKTALAATAATALPTPAHTPVPAPSTIDARNLRDLLNKTGITALTTIFTGINPNIRKCIETALEQRIGIPYGMGMPMGMPMGMGMPPFGMSPFGMMPPGWRPTP